MQCFGVSSWKTVPSMLNIKLSCIARTHPRRPTAHNYQTLLNMLAMAPSPTDHFDISAYKYACSRPGSPRRSDPTPPPLATRNLTYSHHHPLPMDAYSQRPYSAPALPSPPLWSPNIFYPLGALVWYAGSVWRCDSPHTSGALAREVSQAHARWHPAHRPFSPLTVCICGRQWAARSYMVQGTAPTKAPNLPMGNITRCQSGHQQRLSRRLQTARA